ncbi:MAG: C1 family peptidase [Bacteroidaceae bacterium]|nr:C1 family peptidase [Bacteroidaceae bacterium]
MKKILSLLAAGAIALAASGQQNLTPEVLSSLKQSYAGNSADRARQSVVSNGSFRKLAMRPVVNTTGVNTHFSVDIRNTGITDQQSSGRCWMFTGLNVLRNKAMKKIGVSGFQFSHIYLFFYDQLEKSNLFLQGIIDTRNESIDHQKVQWLMQNPLSDGGTYTGVADLVSKYGLVPAEVQAETWASNNTSEIDGHLKRKLREIAINLREQAEAGKSEAELQAYKVEQLKTIYQMLVLAYGEPVQEFLWAPRGKDGKQLSELKKYTPMEFYKEYCGESGDLQNDYVMLMNDPSRPYNKVYEIDMDRHMHDGHNWLYLNLDMKDLAPIAITSLKDSTQMYFSCDVGKFLDSKSGILDIQAWDYNSLLGTTFGMNKKQRIQTRDSGSSHAMTLMAVDLDEKGNPIKWKVENSWGATSGHNGYLIMTNEWFNEYMFRVVVNKKYMPKKLMKLMEQKPILLPAWDPMFMEEK